MSSQARASEEGARSFAGSPRNSGISSSSSGACLDQYAPMLPSDPVKQLPLLPTSVCTSATVRVAAWLLDHDADPATSAASKDGATSAIDCTHLLNNSMGCAGDLHSLTAHLHAHHDAHLEAGYGSSSSVAGEEEQEQDTEALLAELAEEAEQQHQQAAAAAAAKVEVAGGCRRSSLDGFMSQPVKQGDALNNYIASLL